MKIGVASSSELGLALISSLKLEHNIAFLLSTPDKPHKRSSTPMANEFVAGATGYPIYKSTSQDALKQVLVENPVDLVVTLAYGVLISEALLQMPRFGWLNIHFSLLPQWRGASPVQSSLLNGEKIGGFSIFKLDSGLDTGPLYYQEEFEYGESLTSKEILTELASRSASVLNQILKNIENGEMPRSQKGECTNIARKFTPEDGKLEFDLDVRKAFDTWRALSHNPGVYIYIKGIRVKLIRVRKLADSSATPGVAKINKNSVLIGFKGGFLELLEITPSGKKSMSGAEYFRGLRVVDGDSLI